MIKQLIPSEVCLSCKGCCRYSARNSSWAPTLLQEEARDLLRGTIAGTFISETNKLKVITDHSGQNNYLCPCLNVRDDTCTIYPNRPLECQLYPFVLALADAKYVLGVDAQCPFVEQNLLDPEFRKFGDGLLEYFNSSHGRYILQKNPHLFQEYSGIVVLAELKPHVCPQETTTSP